MKLERSTLHRYESPLKGLNARSARQRRRTRHTQGGRSRKRPPTGVLASCGSLVARPSAIILSRQNPPGQGIHQEWSLCRHMTRRLKAIWAPAPLPNIGVFGTWRRIQALMSGYPSTLDLPTQPGVGELPGGKEYAIPGVPLHKGPLAHEGVADPHPSLPLGPETPAPLGEAHPVPSSDMRDRGPVGPRRCPRLRVELDEPLVVDHDEVRKLAGGPGC